MKVRVYYEDTDMAGVVYYANYLRFLERARTDFLERRGIDIKALAKKGVQVTIKDVYIEYKIPAVYGDILEIETEIIQLKTASFRLGHVIKRESDSKLIARAELTCVWVGKDFKPLRIPAEIKLALS
ncbi:MAG: acyl-CoA thioesterase [Candidatus Omnitrophica bacterium]|nr:acyl-CoA thioesterase [Candidatus Omnitrophota bacterium]